MSLRARVLVVLLVVSTAVAATVDTVTFLSLRSFLVRRVDQQLEVAHRPLVRMVGLAPRGGPRPLSLVGVGGLYVEVRDAEGRVLTRGLGAPRPGDPEQAPSLPAELDVPERTARGTAADDVALTTVRRGDGQPRYRVGVWRLSPAGDALVLALPMADVDSTLTRLLVVELVVTGLALAVGVVLARSLVRVGLRPLDDMAATAGAIARGDLGRRVGRDDARTEVGRLGAALNAMLGQIERAFAERRTSEERLRRFVADASHELRTPLTSIRAYAELFDRGAGSRPDDLARVLHGIEAEAARMGVLIDDLLLLARLDQGRPLERAPVDLGALAAEAVGAARAIDGDRHVELSVEGSVEVLGDRLRLRQVVDNLLGNVRAHTPPGTTAHVSVRADPAARTAVVVVADDGPGLTPEQGSRVFERFYRADASRSREGGGTGLGLAIVAAIAAAHGGAAAVAPSRHGGAEFSIELPLLGERPGEAPAPVPAAAPTRGAGN